MRVLGTILVSSSRHAEPPNSIVKYLFLEHSVNRPIELNGPNSLRKVCCTAVSRYFHIISILRTNIKSIRRVWTHHIPELTFAQSTSWTANTSHDQRSASRDCFKFLLSRRYLYNFCILQPDLHCHDQYLNVDVQFNLSITSLWQISSRLLPKGGNGSYFRGALGGSAFLYFAPKHAYQMCSWPGVNAALLPISISTRF